MDGFLEQPDSGPGSLLSCNSRKVSSYKNCSSPIAFTGPRSHETPAHG